MTWKNKTNEEALAAWDNGDSVWSCDQGGMGPGYEQCIQLMGFEMLRAMIANPVNWDDMTGESGRENWAKYCDKIEAVPSVKSAVESLGPSGAQFGSAVNLASVFARNGYSGGMEMVPEDRRIQVSKNFPTIA